MRSCPIVRRRRGVVVAPIPWWGNIGCIPRGPMRPLRHQWRTWEGCNRCTKRSESANVFGRDCGERRNDEVTHKNPCPMFTMGCTGEAAAASFTIDLVTFSNSTLPRLFVIAHQTSWRCPATRLAGRNGSGRAAVADIALQGDDVEG